MADTQSPFSEAAPPRFRFGMDWLLLAMLVAAATASLVGYAFSLPSVRAELDAWLGRAVEASSEGDERPAQLVFLLMCYWSPMMLGLVARLIYLVTTRLLERVKASPSDEEEFRMES